MVVGVKLVDILLNASEIAFLVSLDVHRNGDSRDIDCYMLFFLHKKQRISPIVR